MTKMVTQNEAGRSPFENGRISGPVSARVCIGGRNVLNFFGSAYLALSDLDSVRHAVSHALARGVPFAKQVPAALGVVDEDFDAVERAGADFLDAETSVYIPSGYMIGMTWAAALRDDFDHIYLDAFAHYSLADAARLSGLPITLFHHADPEDVRAQLQRTAAAGSRPLLLTDGVFATTGRVAPLDVYAGLLESYDGRLLVDDSHAFGVVGANGRGAAEHCGVEASAFVGATLSKAFCAQGALLPCTVQEAARLRATAPARGACAGSPLSAAAAAASLRHAAAHPEIRDHIRRVAAHLRARLAALGIPAPDTPAPIVSFEFGKREDMLALCRRAFDRGVLLYHSTYLGAGPEGMIRCGIFRDHSLADVDTLVDVIASQ